MMSRSRPTLREKVEVGRTGRRARAFRRKEVPSRAASIPPYIQGHTYLLSSRLAQDFEYPVVFRTIAIRTRHACLFDRLAHSELGIRLERWSSYSGTSRRRSIDLHRPIDPVESMATEYINKKSILPTQSLTCAFNDTFHPVQMEFCELFFFFIPTVTSNRQRFSRLDTTLLKNPRGIICYLDDSQLTIQFTFVAFEIVIKMFKVVCTDLVNQTQGEKKLSFLSGANLMGGG